MKKIALALVAATALSASSAYKFEISPVYGYAHPEGTQGLSDYQFYGLRLGRNIDTMLVTQIELGADYSEKVKFKNCYGSFTDANSVCYGLQAGEKPDYATPGFNSKLTRFYLNFIKEARLGSFAPYILIGGGWQDYTKQVAQDLAAAQTGFYNNKDSGFAQGGLGLKWYLTEAFAVKAEARYLKDFKGEVTDLYSIGFGLGFGSKNQEVEADEDGDGVPDSLDKCPGTTRGVVVDENGCEVITRLSSSTTDGGGFRFATGKFTLSNAQKDTLRPIADQAAAKSNQYVIVEGHTDSVGRDAFNQQLSEKRANSVREQLVAFGVPANKIYSYGYGKFRPIATNETPEGREQNRRIDIKYTTRDLSVMPDMTNSNLLRLNGNGNQLGFVRGATLTNNQIAELEKLVDMLKGKNDYFVVVSAFTDASGAAAANLRISKQRAAAVARKLIDLGLSADRVIYDGFGATNPIDADTAAGRLQNRRVDVFYKIN